MTSNPNLQEIGSTMPRFGVDRAKVIDFRKFKAFDINGAELCKFQRNSADEWLIANKNLEWHRLEQDATIALENLYVSWLGKQIVQ